MHRSEPESEEFYHERAPELSRRRYPFHPDPEDLEEDVQDTMLAVFRQWHKMKSWSREEQVKYTEGVMRNKYADTYRERGKIKRLRNRMRFRRNHSNLVHVEESALKNEAVKALMSLPPKQRLTLGLHSRPPSLTGTRTSSPVGPSGPMTPAAGMETGGRVSSGGAEISSSSSPERTAS